MSADGCYVYIYGIEDYQADNDNNAEIEEDLLLDTYGDENPYLLTEHKKKVVEITHAIQKFQRGSSTCKEIYSPIQFVHGFSTKNHNRDFVLLSSSSMTTHMFVLNEETEDEKLARTKQASGWTWSKLLPDSLTLDRSAIRLNV